MRQCLNQMKQPVGLAPQVYPKQYLSSGFQSVQSAVDGYVAGAAPGDDTALEAPPAGNGSSAAFTEWASPFPTAAYIHNRFYDGGRPMAACPAFPLHAVAAAAEPPTRAL